MKNTGKLLFKSIGYVLGLNALSLGLASLSAWSILDSDFWFVGLQIAVLLLFAPLYFYLKYDTHAPFWYMLSTALSHSMISFGGGYFLQWLYDRSGAGYGVFLGGIEFSVTVVCLTLYVAVILLIDLIVTGCRLYRKHMHG